MGLALASQAAFEMNGAVFSALILLMRTNSGSSPLGEKRKSLHCQLDALLKEKSSSHLI